MLLKELEDSASSVIIVFLPKNKLFYLFVSVNMIMYVHTCI